MAKRDYEEEEAVALDETTLEEIQEIQDQAQELIVDAILAGKLLGLDEAMAETEDGQLAFALYFKFTEAELKKLRKASKEYN